MHKVRFAYNNNVAGGRCAGSDMMSLNSKCYTKFDVQRTWFSASNECLSRGGSLAVFSDVGLPSDNPGLTDRLDTDKTYWIGLVRSWWTINNEGCVRVASF